MASLSREFSKESKQVHYAHTAVTNELASMSVALDKLCTKDDEFANLSAAKQVQFLARDIRGQIIPHFRHEEATVFRTVSEVSRELASFAAEMCREHEDLEKRFTAFCQILDDLEAVEDMATTLCEVKRLGHDLVRDLERHMNAEENHLSGFL